MKSFREGFFKSVDVDALEVSKQTRKYLKSTPASVALLEYASLTNDVEEQVSEKLRKQIVWTYMLSGNTSAIENSQYLR
ncbi:MAG: hypothetical protein OSJ62_04545 [Lachnospiraceae bacterium]|nr:hypothetical protein [Lachnospiraceae bacterium]